MESHDDYVPQPFTEAGARSFQRKFNPFDDIDMQLEQLSSSWKDKLSLNMGMDIEGEGVQGTIPAPAASLPIRYGDTSEMFDLPVSAEQIANRFRLARQLPGGFLLRDDDDGCVVPLSSAVPGTGYTLELIPASSDPGSGGRKQPVPTGVATAAQATQAAAGGGGENVLRFLQEPPHGAAVWLHAKTTQKGELASSCAAHVFSPPPRVALNAAALGRPISDLEASTLLSTIRVSLVDASGADSSALRPGKMTITRDPASGEWSVVWPEMAVMDISRSVAEYAGNQKISAAELQSQRGALGWFCLKVVIPGCPEAAPLWLSDRATGEKARIVIKNERNAKLGWQQNAQGPYADHSRCMPSHIGADGQRLCCGGGGDGGGAGGLRHGGCSGNVTGAAGSGFLCVPIKTEPLC